MNLNDTREWHRLFNAALNDQLTAADKLALAAVLKSSAEARQLWFLYHDNECALAELKRPAESKPSVESIARKPSLSWMQWRPLSAAAAGLVFGMICTSVVLAYAVPRMKPDRRRVIPLFSESFEDENTVLGRGFPSFAGGWSGDFAAVVPTEGGVSPKEGQSMARLFLASTSVRKFCAAARIVDLVELPPRSASESRTVEVTASFHGVDTEWADRNQIRLAAFSEAPQDVRAIWNADSRLEQALLHLGRTVTVKPGEHGWQTLKVSMEIPAGARSLVIHLGAGVADDAGPKTVHYIDDVHAQIVIKETAPEN